MWKSENDSNMVHLDAYFVFENGEKKSSFSIIVNLRNKTGEEKKTANLVLHV